jgi:hypothetical protein
LENPSRREFIGECFGYVTFYRNRLWLDEPPQELVIQYALGEFDLGAGCVGWYLVGK